MFLTMWLLHQNKNDKEKKWSKFFNWYFDMEGIKHQKVYDHWKALKIIFHLELSSSIGLEVMMERTWYMQIRPI